MLGEDREPRDATVDRTRVRVAIALPHPSRADVEGEAVIENDPASYEQVLASLWGFVTIGHFVWLTFLGGLEATWKAACVAHDLVREARSDQQRDTQ